MGFQASATEAVVVDVGVDVVDVAVEMVKVTGMDWEVFVAPTPVTVMVVEYVPAPSPEISAVALKEDGAVPVTGESASHGAVVLTLQFNAPLPELEMATACPAGLLAP
jgi:hypothetical protein